MAARPARGTATAAVASLATVANGVRPLGCGRPQPQRDGRPAWLAGASASVARGQRSRSLQGTAPSSPGGGGDHARTTVPLERGAQREIRHEAHAGIVGSERASRRGRRSTARTTRGQVVALRARREPPAGQRVARGPRRAPGGAAGERRRAVARAPARRGGGTARAGRELGHPWITGGRPAQLTSPRDSVPGSGARCPPRSRGSRRAPSRAPRCARSRRSSRGRAMRPARSRREG